MHCHSYKAFLIYLFCLCFRLKAAVNSNCLDFYKDVSISPDATIPEIVKEIKEKQAEISLKAKRIWGWNKTSLRLKSKHCTVFKRSEIIKHPFLKQLILITIHCLISKR